MSVKCPHDLSDESDSEADSDNDLGLGDVLGAGINSVPMLAGLGDDELSGTIVQESSSSGNTLPCTTQLNEPTSVSQTSDVQIDDIDPDLPSLKQDTQNFYPSARVVKWVHDAMNLELSNEQIKTVEKSFTHDSSLDDIFKPIKSIKALSDPIKCKATQEADGKGF